MFRSSIFISIFIVVVIVFVISVCVIPVIGPEKSQWWIEDQWANNKEAFQPAITTGERTWSQIEANPVPVLVALVTFFLTIVYHKLRGRKWNESLDAAVARTVINVVHDATETLPPSTPPEDPVILRSRNRMLLSQLYSDKIILENKINKLPEEIKRAEQHASWAKEEHRQAEFNLVTKKKADEQDLVKLWLEQTTAKDEYDRIDRAIAEMKGTII